MKVTTYGMVDSEVKHRSPSQASSISVELTEQTVDDAGGFGVSIGSIDVQRADGKTARFWVRVSRSHQGRIKAEIRANHAQHETAKRVTGSWLDYEARRTEALATDDAEIADEIAVDGASYEEATGKTLGAK